MKSPLRFFFHSIAVTLILSLLLFGGIYLYTQSLDSRLSEAIRSCEVASKTETLEIQRNSPDAPVAQKPGMFDDLQTPTTPTQPVNTPVEPRGMFWDLQNPSVIKGAGNKPSTGQADTNQNPFDKFDYQGMHCEPSELYALRHDGNAMRLIAPHYRSIITIFGEKSNVEYYRLAGYLLIFLILFVGVLPLLWYFFLRRLKEVAAAIRGS